MSQCHWITNGARCTEYTPYNICVKCLPLEVNAYELYKRSSDAVISNLNPQKITGMAHDLNNILLCITATMILRSKLVSSLYSQSITDAKYSIMPLLLALSTYMDKLYIVWNNNPYTDATISHITSLESLLFNMTSDPLTNVDASIISNITLARTAHNNWVKLRDMCDHTDTDMLYLHMYIIELNKHLDKCLESIPSLISGGKVISEVEGKLRTSPPSINTIISMWNQTLRFPTQAQGITWYKAVVTFAKARSSYTLESCIQSVDGKFTIIVKHDDTYLAVHWRVTYWDMQVIS